MLRTFSRSVQAGTNLIEEIHVSPKPYKYMGNIAMLLHGEGLARPHNLFRIMKLLTLFMLAALSQVWATGYSQKITLERRHITLESALKIIEKQTDYLFLYDKQELPTGKEVSVSIKNGSIEATLDQLLDGLPLSYKIFNRNIVIRREEQGKRKDASHLSPADDPAPAKIVSGTVTDEKGEGLPGVNILIKGTQKGMITNSEGIFSIEVTDENSILVFSFVGYLTKEITVGTKTNLTIVLEPDTKSLEEVVVVGFGTQKKISSTGAISSVSNEEIMRSPVANVVNALTGTMSGLTIVNNSGHVGKDNPVIRLRGIGTMSGQLDPLVMVDGMERPMNDIDPNEIESVSILKDASSTAVFGVRGANGVILVTTKRGKNGPAKVSFAAEYGVSTPTRLPEFLESYEYAQLYNEAQINDGVAPGNVKYSPEALEHFRTGDDPWLYPNTNWQKQMMRSSSPQQRYNLNISGGTERTRYYVSAGYLSQVGIWKDFDLGYDNTDNFKRYNFRSNLDIDVTKMLTASISLGGQIKNVNLPNAQRTDPNDEDWQLFRYMMAAPPMAGAGWVNGRSYIVEGYETPIKWMTGKGFRNDYDSNVNVLFNINHKLDFITPGLTFRAKYGYDSFYSVNLRRARTLAEYAPQRREIDQDGDGIPEEVLLFKTIGTTSLLNYAETSDSKRRHVYVEAALDWNRTFGTDHDVSVLALYNQSKKYYTESAFNEIPLSYLGLVGRFTYSYKSKYNAEVNMGYNGSENFPADKRFGLFPAYSVAWVASEESFMKGLPLISFLKFKVSYGKVGNDKLGGNRFLYIPDSYSMSYTGGPVFGTNGSGQGYGTASLIKRGNPEVSWEIDEKQNYGVELKLLQDRFSFNFDYFRNYRYNILRTRSTYTSYVDDNIPPVNFGKMSNHGYEIETMWRERKGAVTYWIRGVYSFARNKVIEMDEPATVPDYQKQTGRPFGRRLLYLVDGFYETDEEVAAANGIAPQPGIATNSLGVVRKGDLRFVDFNKDGRIDDLDRTSYGNYTLVPEISGSVSLGTSFNGFDFSVLFQGVTHALVTYGGESLQPFASQYLSPMSAQTYIRGRWTEETKATATYPALTVLPAHYNFGEANGAGNTFFTNDASYIRLKTAEVAYTFSGKLLQRIKLQSLRIYFNGSNLVTWDKQKLFKTDPEQPGGRGLAYPQTKIFNLGLNLQM